MKEYLPGGELSILFSYYKVMIAAKKPAKIKATFNSF